MEKKREQLPSDHRAIYSCGLWCTIGLFAGILIFTGSFVFVTLDDKFDVNSQNSTLVSCPASSHSHTENFEYLYYLWSIDFVFSAFNLFHISVVLYGFKSLIDFSSGYTKFEFTDIFYCISSVGSVIFLSFCAIANLATREGTTVTDWNFDYHSNNSQIHSNIVYTMLFGVQYCASDLISSTSMTSFAYEVSQLIQIILSSLFVLHASQMLPHGQTKKNKSINEVIQFLGVVHLFLWMVNSFVYSPHIYQLFVVETFYFGHSTFGVIARLTFPLIVFYHFATFLRCIRLFNRYDSNP